jgi:hypothetical protein
MAKLRSMLARLYIVAIRQTMPCARQHHEGHNAHIMYKYGKQTLAQGMHQVSTAPCRARKLVDGSKFTGRRPDLSEIMEGYSTG